MIRTWISASMRLVPQQGTRSGRAGGPGYGTGRARRPAPSGREVRWTPLLRLGDDALERGRPAGADLVARDHATLDVAILVERRRADDGVEATGAHDRLEHVQPVVRVRAGLRQRVEDDLGGRLGVRGVERGLVAVVGRLVVGSPR